MPLNKGKHTIAEINGTRCTVVETGTDQARTAFLGEILAANGYTVMTEQEKSKDGTPMETFVIGVTDLLFNPMIAVYQHKLRLRDGRVVSPACWNQWSVPTDIPYWQVNR